MDSGRAETRLHKAGEPLVSNPVGFGTVRLSSTLALTDVIESVWRRRLALAAWLAACVTIAVWYVTVAPIVYTSATTVVLEPRQNSYAVGSGQASVSPVLDVAQAESQIQVIRSERILSTVFEVLNLESSDQFKAPQPSIMARFGSILSGSNAPSPDPALAKARAFQSFVDRVGVRRLGQSYVLEISYQASNASDAARIANSIAIQYIKAQVDVKAAAVLQGTEYLRGRIVNIELEQKAATEGVRLGQVPDMIMSDADARIIGAALKPLAKSYPKSSLILLFAVLFGVVTGLLAVAIRHALDNTVGGKRVIVDDLKLNTYGSIPKVAKVRGRASPSRLPLKEVIQHNPHSVFSKCMQRIRTQLFLSATPNNALSVGIVSWSRGDGRSTIALCLAKTIGLSGMAVTLIDADFSNPVLTNVLARNCEGGLADYLTRSEPDMQRLFFKTDDKINFCPGKGADKELDPYVYLGSDKMHSLLTQSKACGHVLIDLAPMSISPDAQAIAQFLDGFIIVVEPRRTQVAEVVEICRLIEAANGKILGVILNKDSLVKA